MKTVLVTGGTGLVGSAINQISKNYNYNFIFISSKDYDLTNMFETIRMFEKHRPHFVIHLAACVGGLFKNMNNKVEMLEKNLMINYNVVKCSHDYKVEKLIGALSTCIFPDKTTYPINETMLQSGPPHPSNDGYAYAKRMLDTHCKAYRENFNDNFICFIPTNIYGINDNFNLEDSHVLPGLIHKCYLAKKNNTDFIVRGTGTPLRQFIYSEDLAKLIMWVLEDYNEKDNIILSVSEKEEVSIGYIAYIIATEFGYSHRLVFDSKYSDGQFKKTADNTKLMTHIKDFNNTDITNGIKKTIKYFIENYDNIRK